jgi:hypothetical protein
MWFRKRRPLPLEDHEQERARMADLNITSHNIAEVTQIDWN